MGFRQRIAQPEVVCWNQDQVHMVRHQAMCQHLGTSVAPRDRQQAAILGVILIAEKGPLAPMASLRHVMGQSWRDHSGESSHASVRPSPTKSAVSHDIRASDPLA
jgi:hypothetical protein